jgi:hypothetical protein
LLATGFTAFEVTFETLAAGAMVAAGAGVDATCSGGAVDADASSP